MAFERVCAASQVQLNTPLRVEVSGQTICLARDSAGQVHAIGDRCTHGDISLSEGFVEEDAVECWAHGAKFSMHTGWPQNLPAYEPVPVYQVKIENDDIYIDPTPIMKENI